MSREKPSQRHIPAAHKIGQQPSSGDATLVTCPSNNPEHAPSPHPNMHHFPTGRIRALAPHRRVAARMWPSRKSWDKSRSWPTSWLRRAHPPASPMAPNPTPRPVGPPKAAPSASSVSAHTNRTSHHSHVGPLEGLTPSREHDQGWTSTQPTPRRSDEVGTRPSPQSEQALEESHGPRGTQNESHAECLQCTHLFDSDSRAKPRRRTSLRPIYEGFLGFS